MSIRPSIRQSACSEMSALEPRRLLAQTIDLFSSGQLVIFGSSASERLNLSVTSGKFTAEFVSGLKKTYTATSVKKVVVSMLQGNDLLYTSTSVMVPVVGDGGPDNDTIYGGAGNDTLTGGTGNDRVYAASGNDSVKGGIGNDWLQGESGNDTLVDEAGNDSLFGGTDKDTLFGSPDGTDTDIYDGGTGGHDYDYFTYNGRTRGVRIATDGSPISGYGTLTRTGASTERDQIKNFTAFKGTTFGDIVLVLGTPSTYAGSGGAVSVDGDYGSDTIVGSSQLDNLAGGRGSDEIVGNGGNDYLYGNSFGTTKASEEGAYADNDTVLGGTGNDYVLGGTGYDNLYGDSGNDTLIGETGNDYLSGGSGTDRLLGNAGNDYLWGDSGRDYFDGGDGNDRLHADDDEIDTLLGGNGSDWADVDKLNNSLIDSVSSVETLI